jgi:hypothetical protein
MAITKKDIRILKLWKQPQRKSAKTLHMEQCNVSRQRKIIRKKVLKLIKENELLIKMKVIDDEGNWILD